MKFNEVVLMSLLERDKSVRLLVASISVMSVFFLSTLLVKLFSAKHFLKAIGNSFFGWSSKKFLFQRL